jgi:hypothetical protein
LRDDFRIELSARRETYVAADVRAFFHSIYTHAIAWAIHGKEVAKQQRGTALYGNLIDLLCRNAQDGQTIGLPVGPDTSRLIAEIVAAAMDVQLQGRLGSRAGSARAVVIASRSVSESIGSPFGAKKKPSRRWSRGLG